MRRALVVLALVACGGQQTPPPEPPKDDPRLVALPTWAYERLRQEEVPLLSVKLRLCRDPQGVPNKVTLERPAEWPELEAYYAEALKPWRKAPVIVSGAAIPTCEPVRFRYLVDDGTKPTIPSAFEGHKEMLQLSRRMEHFVQVNRLGKLSLAFRVCAAADGVMQSMTMEILQTADEIPWIEDEYRERFQAVKWPYPPSAPPGKVVCRGVVLNYVITP